MSQIKSYLSLESVPSLEFRTPPKNVLLYLPTNNSMTYSNTMGSSDYKSQWNKRTFYNSHQLFKEPNYQARDQVEQLSGEIENNSAVTLSPAITPADILELANAVKMVAFLSFKTEEDRKRIQKKTASIKSLRSKIFLLEEQAAYCKQQIQKKEKSIKSRSLSLRKQKHAVHQNIHNQMLDIKLNIKQIKRSLSAKKATIEVKRSSEEKRRHQAATERQNSRKRVYIPIPFHYPQPFFAGPEQYRQRNTSYSQHHPQAAPSLDVNYILTPDLTERAPKSSHRTSNKSHKTPSLGASRNSQPPLYPPATIGNMRNSNNGLNENHILGLIQEKLRMPSNPIVNEFPKSQREEKNHRYNIQPKQNPEQMPKLQANSAFLEMLGPAIFKEVNTSNQSYKVNILKEEEKSPSLDYFDDSFEKQLDLNQDRLMNSQRSRKSIKMLKQSSKNITNKWKKDEEDHEIVELLAESIRSPTKPQQEDISTLKPPPVRTEIGAKLVETSVKQEDSFNFELPDTSREQARQPQIANSSHVEIFVAENSEDNSKIQSLGSEKKISIKNGERQEINNSAIGIEVNDSVEELPPNPDQARNSPRKMGLAVKKEIESIEEMEEDCYSRANTPVDFKLSHNIDPSVESSYIPTPRETQREPFPMASSLEKSSPRTPPLTRPPSLIEQQEEDSEEDVLNSIKLATNSKFSSEPKSKINRLSQSIELDPQNAENPIQAPSAIEEEEEEDFLGGIQLARMSKISREKSEKKQRVSDDFESVPNPSPDKMARSELSPATNFNNDEEGMDMVDSELRKSTNSVIVKKGSAIQRSRKESPPAAASAASGGSGGSGLRSSNRGSFLSGTSHVLSSPIEEAAEEQQEYSAIVKKHKRNVTTSQL